MLRPVHFEERNQTISVDSAGELVWWCVPEDPTDSRVDGWEGVLKALMGLS